MIPSDNRSNDPDHQSAQTAIPIPISGAGGQPISSQDTAFARSIGTPPQRPGSLPPEASSYGSSERSFGRMNSSEMQRPPIAPSKRSQSHSFDEHNPSSFVRSKSGLDGGSSKVQQVSFSPGTHTNRGSTSVRTLSLDVLSMSV